MPTNDADTLPLPAATFNVLLALRAGELHGYAVMTEVERLSDGAVRMGPGTLYGTIKRLVDGGLIVESDERPEAKTDDERRRYYRLTDRGQRVLAAEVQRLHQMMHRAGVLRPGLETA